MTSKQWPLVNKGHYFGGTKSLYTRLTVCQIKPNMYLTNIRAFFDLFKLTVNFFSLSRISNPRILAFTFKPDPSQYVLSSSDWSTFWEDPKVVPKFQALDRLELSLFLRFSRGVTLSLSSWNEVCDVIYFNLSWGSPTCSPIS